MNRVFLFCFQNRLSLIRQSLKPYNFASEKKNSVCGVSMLRLPHFFFFWKIPKHALNFVYKFYFLEVNLCEMRYFKTVIFIVVRNGFEIFKF